MKTITSVELARLAGVSQSTVSRCLNDSPLVSEKTKQKVKKIAQAYSFQFNSNARGLKTNKTGIIGYVFSEDFEGFANHYIQSDLYFRIRSKLIPHCLDLVPVFDDTIPGEMPSIEKSISNRRFDALIINRPHVNDRVKELLEKTHLPHIFIYDTGESSNETGYMISPNHTESGELVGETFCQRGFTDFVEMTGPSHRLDVQHKHQGFISALEKHGLTLPADHILPTNYRLQNATEVALRYIRLFRPGTACFAQNDMIALGLIEALSQNHIRVPEDVAVIGYDNVPMSCWFKPHLTTIAIDYDRIIDLTAQWVLAVAQDQEAPIGQVQIHGQLILRDTL